MAHLQELVAEREKYREDLERWSKDLDSSATKSKSLEVCSYMFLYKHAFVLVTFMTETELAIIYYLIQPRVALFLGSCDLTNSLKLRDHGFPILSFLAVK